MSATDQFTASRFGMFVQWGLYAVAAEEWQDKRMPAAAEWLMNFSKIPLSEYKTLMQGFTGEAFDADAIAGLAKSCGMKYVIMAAKHHEGFALFDSAVSDYNSMNTPFGRDAVWEMADACHRAGLRFGLYYSQAQDWATPDAYGNTWEHANVPQHFERYLETKVKPQLRELLIHNGLISMLLFDTPQGMTLEQSRSIIKYIKSFQPGCLISGRIGNGLGDYRCVSDNQVPASALAGPWEAKVTLNDMDADDDGWKQPRDIVKRLVSIAAKGGNCLLTVSPDAAGRIPSNTADALSKVGDWMAVNGEAIYDTDVVPVFPYLFEFGLATCRRKRDAEPCKLYLHIIDWGKGYENIQGELVIYGVRNRVTRAYALANLVPVAVRQSPPTASCALHSMTISLPDEPFDAIDSVVCLELEDDLRVDRIEGNTPL